MSHDSCKHIPSHVSRDGAGSLCLGVGCGVETKSGARRVIEPSELSPVASLVKKIIDTRLSEAPVQICQLFNLKKKYQLDHGFLILFPNANTCNL